MADVIRLMPDEARELIMSALIGAGASKKNVTYFTDAILDTELSGLEGHGFYWLQFYCRHLRSGKVDGRVIPRIKRLSPVAFRADARNGFAHPAIEKGFTSLIPAAKKYGVAALGVHNSYNAATLGYHTGYLARRGLVAFGYTNSVPAIAPVGGTKPIIGTNPMSFAVPGRRGEIAFLIDQSASAIAWTAVKRAADTGQSIPLGWALDSKGQPTSDPALGLAGSMAPSGGYKGFSNGLITEVLCAALAGGHLGTAMGSFTEDDGRPIGCGQFFVALNPKLFSPGYFDKQLNTLGRSITSQNGARLPNARRELNQRRLAREGMTIDSDLYRTLLSFAEAAKTASAGRRGGKR